MTAKEKEDTMRQIIELSLKLRNEDFTCMVLLYDKKISLRATYVCGNANDFIKHLLVGAKDNVNLHKALQKIKLHLPSEPTQIQL